MTPLGHRSNMRRKGTLGGVQSVQGKRKTLKAQGLQGRRKGKTYAPGSPPRRSLELAGRRQGFKLQTNPRTGPCNTFAQRSGGGMRRVDQRSLTAVERQTRHLCAPVQIVRGLEAGSGSKGTHAIVLGDRDNGTKMGTHAAELEHGAHPSESLCKARGTQHGINECEEKSCGMQGNSKGPKPGSTNTKHAHQEAHVNALNLTIEGGSNELHSEMTPLGPAYDTGLELENELVYVSDVSDELTNEMENPSTHSTYSCPQHTHHQANPPNTSNHTQVNPMDNDAPHQNLNENDAPQEIDDTQEKLKENEVPHDIIITSTMQTHGDQIIRQLEVKQPTDGPINIIHLGDGCTIDLSTTKPRRIKGGWIFVTDDEWKTISEWEKQHQKMKTPDAPNTSVAPTIILRPRGRPKKYTQENQKPANRKKTKTNKKPTTSNGEHEDALTQGMNLTLFPVPLTLTEWPSREMMSAAAIVGMDPQGQTGEDMDTYIAHMRNLEVERVHMGTRGDK
ncbi:hypothetical protein J5N97_021845 [Dioscorea zingiberensis]|uniref:Uncharacterized protein n=1 Tax=Dioscorea zingiberensis TaxID=325984 RepID=A0A9D5C9F1_9LILI|nr:hypothetical protein J5N97_021845 [Dioscorea zingiberensis]